MDYFINEYSLNGQFANISDFFKSLREYTLPVLNRIEAKKDNVIWQKDTLWQCKICNEITLGNIPQKKNERTSEITALKNRLIKLINTMPSWSEFDKSDISVNEYLFDFENRELFRESNCFIKAIENEGRIISFENEVYKAKSLTLLLKDSKDYIVKCELDNIYSINWWHCEPTIKTWYILGKYLVEVRAKEFDYHPPHFHVSYNDYAAVFRLKDGMLYRQGKKKFSEGMLKEIKEWYESNKTELEESWKLLHNEETEDYKNV